MSSGQPSPGGGLSSVAHPERFPATFSLLEKKALPMTVIYESGVSSGTTYTTNYDIGLCQGFTVYSLNSTGAWNVQVSPNPNNPQSGWVDYAAADISGNGYISVTNFHPHMRVVMKNGYNGIIWLYRKYATH